MYFTLENTPAKKAAFNRKSNDKYGWLSTLPWHLFGIDQSDGISHQEILNLQNAVGCDADGLVGLSTLQHVQDTLRKRHHVLWNPCTGSVQDVNDFSRSMYWNGLEIPLNSCTYPIHTYKESQGIDLHFTGNFNKLDRKLNSVIVHWGGLNPQHLARVFANRKASSHIAVGRSESTGEVGIYQMVDLAHMTWHAVGANRHSIGIDVCQQPELKHLGYFVGKGYDVKTIDNPAYPEYGPAKIISLDPEIEAAVAEILVALRCAFGLPETIPLTSEGKITEEQMEKGGIFSHFHVDHKGQGKWDIAPWWDLIVNRISEFS